MSATGSFGPFLNVLYDSVKERVIVERVGDGACEDQSFEELLRLLNRVQERLRFHHDRCLTLAAVRGVIAWKRSLRGVSWSWKPIKRLPISGWRSLRWCPCGSLPSIIPA